MDSAFERPEYGVSSAFVYCLWMIWSGFFKFSDTALTRVYESEIYDKISRELSCILRHSGWVHADQSLTIFELMAGARFRKMRSHWAHTCKATEDSVFPVVQKAQLQPWCEASVDRINLLLPLAITIMYNQKGRYQIGILSTSDHQKGERFVGSPEAWIHPAGMTAEDRRELAQLYKQFRAAHVFVQTVSGHSGDAAAPTAGLKISKCQLSDMPDTLVHMTEYRHVRSIQQYGLLPGGGNIVGKQRDMNHFLPIDGLMVSYEHIRPTAHVILVLSKATLEQRPELMENFCLSKNGYFLTKDVIPAGLFSLAWDIRNNCCLSTKLWDIPGSTPAMSVHDEPHLRFYSQLYCEVVRLVGKGHNKFAIETRQTAFKNIKIREVEAWRRDAEEKLDRHELHAKLHTETWLNFLSLDDEWKDAETNMRRLKKRSLSETTEEEGDDLIDVDDDDDMEVDADIPAEDDDDDVQVISNLDETMLDDLAEARQKGTWVKKGTVHEKEESDMPDDPSAAASSSSAVKKEEGQSRRVWSSRARSRTPSRTVLKKADHAPGAARTPSEGRRVSFSDTPETKYFDPQPKKRATSRAREVISDARKAQESPIKYFHRPEKMTCLVCSKAKVLFFCRACSHGTCLDCYHEVDNHCSCNSIYLCSTVPDADIPAPLGEHEREEITAEIDFTIPFAAESEGWRPDDRYAGRLHRLQEIKDLVLGGGSTGYAAMDRIVLGVSKYHYTNHPTCKSRSIPSIAQHWDEQSDVAPYPIIRPSCFYDSNRRYSGEEMRQIVELSRSYMQGYRANQGDFDLDEARRLRSTEHVSVLLLNFGDINRTLSIRY